MSLRLQPRDYAILGDLYDCRIMTLAHVTSRYFGGKYDAASKRIQLLKIAGYIGDRRSQVGERSLLYLTKQAFQYLNTEGKLSHLPKLTVEQFSRRSRVRDSTIKHELSVMDVRVALTAAITSCMIHQIETFTTWPLLSEFAAFHPRQRQRIIVRPDGFLRVTETSGPGREYNFFLEVDRSNEVQQVLVEKALCYRDFYAQGGFAQRCGGTVDDFRDYPFRVLIVLQNAERRNNLAERLMNCTPPVKFQTWLTTMDEVLRDPLGKIWVCPLDYAHATAGTIYSPEQCRNVGKYVRRSEREKLVEQRIVKRTLFEDASPTPLDSVG
jgi:hypothetical protein